MTKEEVKEIFDHNWTKLVNPDYSDDDLAGAQNWVIEALSAEPQGDSISREAVLNLYEEYRPRLATNVCEFGDALEQIPPVEQTEWISREVILNKIAEIDKLSKAGKTDEALALMKECFESLSPSSEWISVKDRLPELGQMVLVTYADGDVETNERMTLKNLEVWKYGNSVVAWMPLPSPYKGE